MLGDVLHAPHRLGVQGAGQQADGGVYLNAALKRARHRLAVDVKPLVLETHGVARQADDPLDVILVLMGRYEHRHLAALGPRHPHDAGADDRQPQAVGVFVHHDEIPHLKGGDHRAGGNLKRLRQKGTQQKHQQQHRKKRPRVFHRHRLRRNRFRAGALQTGHLQPPPPQPKPVAQPDTPGGQHQHQQHDGKIDVHQESTFNTARNAACGTSTLPTCFIRFLPAFCFSSSFFLRVTSPP